MIGRQLPAPEVLPNLLRYDPETGKLFWFSRDRSLFGSDNAHRTWNSRYANKEAFTYIEHCYRVGRVFGVRIFAHRVIWALQTGEWPNGYIDHIDQNKLNNSWSNLRVATKSQNAANRPSKSGSSSKYLGVAKTECKKKWFAAISKNNKKTWLGRFSCEIEAAKAYDAAAKQIHGEFANLNFPDQQKEAA